MYIARFLSVEDAEYVFKGEFCLNSLRYYRSIEQESLRDEHELEVNTSYKELLNDSLVKGELLNDFLVSCWIKIESDKIEDNDWGIFPDKDDVAIISTVKDIDSFLKERLRVFVSKEKKETYIA